MAELFVETNRLAETTGKVSANPGNVLEAYAFTLVAENQDGTQARVNFVPKPEVNKSNQPGFIFRFRPPDQTKRLWLCFGGEGNPPITWKLSSNFWNLIWNFTQPETIASEWWKVSHPSISIKPDVNNHRQTLRIDFDDKAGDVPATVQVSRSFAVPPDARGSDAVFSLDLNFAGEGYLPVNVQLQQFDADGKRIDACVVDPRWLSICLAAGQDVNFREKGYFYPNVASVTMVIAMHPAQTRNKIMNADGAWHKYPGSDAFTLHINRAEIRAAHQISFPGFNKARFAEGFTGAEGDLSFNAGKDAGICYDALPPSVCGEGIFPKEASAYPWPYGAGTFECWVMPEWDANDAGRRYIMQSNPNNRPVYNVYYRPETEKLYAGDIETAVALTPHQWHHVAFTWNPKGGREELFVDGKKVASVEGKRVRSGKPHDLSIVPSSVWIGNSRVLSKPGSADEAFHGRIDEVRVSDGIRYETDFTPSRAPFTLDTDTRALFHFDGRKDGIHAGVEGRIIAACVSPEPPLSPTLSVVKAGKPVEIVWTSKDVPDAMNPLKLLPVNPYTPPGAADFAKPLIERQATLRLKPGEAGTVHCEGVPRMDWVEVRCPDDGQAIEAPFLSHPGEADPRTLKKLAESLGVANMKTDRERADAIFKYLLNANNYYLYRQADIQPSGEVIDPGSCPTLNLNSYMQFECGDQNTMAKYAFLAGGVSSNIVMGAGHMIEHVFYDGSWHLYDMTPRLFFPARDNEHMASLAEIQEDPALITRFPSDAATDFYLLAANRPYKFDDRQLALPEMTYRLRPGESFRYHWTNAGRYNPTYSGRPEHTTLWVEGSKATGKDIYRGTHFPPYIGNGVFSFACEPKQDHPALSHWNNGEFVYEFYSPFVIVGAAAKAQTAADAAPAISISYDEGKTWMPLQASATDDGMINLDEAAMARHFYWLKVTPAAGTTVTRFEHHAIVEMNPKILTPVLAQGENRLIFTADKGSVAEINIHYQEEAPGELEVVGGARFGWTKPYEGQLFVCQPGKSLDFDVRGNGIAPTLSALTGVSTTVTQIGDGNTWHVTMKLPATLQDGLYDISVRSGDRVRPVALLAAKGAEIVAAEDAKTQGSTALTDDPNNLRGKVLQINQGGTATFPLSGMGTAPIGVFALAKCPPGSPAGMASIATDNGDVRFIEPNTQYAYFAQNYLQREWKWYNPRIGHWPDMTLQALNPPQSHAITIKGTAGTVLVDAVLVIPASDERLMESLLQYMFSANYRPWDFDRDWGPITAGIPYSVR